MREIVDKVIAFHSLSGNRKPTFKSVEEARIADRVDYPYYFYLCDIVACVTDFNACGHKFLGFTDDEKIEITEHFLVYMYEYFFDLRKDSKFLSHLAKKIEAENYSYKINMQYELNIYLNEKLTQEMKNDKKTDRRFKI